MLNSWSKMEDSFCWINESWKETKQNENNPALQKHSNAVYILFFGLIYIWCLKLLHIFWVFQ